MTFSKEIDKLGFASRLNQVLDTRNFPPRYKGRIQQLADLFNMSHRGIGKWLNGEAIPPLRKFPIIAEKLQVSDKWLRSGEGSMFHPIIDNVDRVLESSFLYVSCPQCKKTFAVSK